MTTTQVLEFTGGGASNVNHGFFWDGTSQLGNRMCWDAWVKNLSSGGYYVSDGYGGGHALLWGPGGGNVWNGTGTVSFGGDDGGGDMWHHASVSMSPDRNGNPRIYRFINGICDGKAAFTGTRTAVSASAGGRTLFVGGSNHSNGAFLLAQLRAFDKQNPHCLTGNGYGCHAFYPQRHLGAELGDGVLADFLADYTVPCLIIPDLSHGYGGGGAGARTQHPGRLGTPIEYPPGERCGAWPRPTWVSDTDAPFDADGALSCHERGYTPATVPTGARIFDSFERDDSIPAWTIDPNLGDTEGGSLGPLTYSYWNHQPGATWPSRWGVFNGRAVRLSGHPGVAWVDNGQADMDARVSRRKGAWGSGETGLALRVGTGGNFLYVTYLHDSNVVTYGRFSGGVQQGVVNWTPPSSWTTLRVTLVGNTLTAYADSTTLGTLTDSTHASNTGAGLFYSGPGFTSDMAGESSLARWDNFTVFAP